MKHTQRKAGDRAVDGLLPGIAAGVVMIGYLVLNGLMNGVRVSQMLANFSPAGDSAFSGLLTHLAVSSVYGLLFSLLVGRLDGRRVILAGGLLYGLVLFAVGNALLIPIMMEALANFGSLALLVAHLLYGVTLGVIFMRGT